MIIKCDTDKSKSPAASSCLNDRTAGKTWTMGSVLILKNSNLYSSRVDGIPAGVSDYYWTFGTNQDSTAKGVNFYSNTRDFLKDNFLYVLCISSN